MTEKMAKNYKISAVICELNPLHKGHRAIFQHAKQLSSGTVCILSGNFVQRGEPAILDKWARCLLALENGADLVIELPLPWACAGAERFAAGGIHLANALGNVDTLVFGSESADLSAIKTAAMALLSEEFSAKLAAIPDNGDTFARRREAALGEMLGEEILPLLRSPNAILGIEYTKALLRESSAIVPTAFKRIGAGHDAEAAVGEFHSASELRAMLRDGQSLDSYVPQSTATLLRKLTADGKCPTDIMYLERAILYRLRTMQPADFAKLPDISEGLENRLFNAAASAASLEEFYELAKSKRYTHARLRRLVIAALLGITADLPALPPYIRVLGMNSIGQEILKSVKTTLPIIARAADVQKLDAAAQRIFELEAHADDIYALSCPTPQPCGRDYTEKLIKL